MSCLLSHRYTYSPLYLTFTKWLKLSSSCSQNMRLLLKSGAVMQFNADMGCSFHCSYKHVVDVRLRTVKSGQMFDQWHSQIDSFFVVEAVEAAWRFLLSILRLGVDNMLPNVPENSTELCQDEMNLKLLWSYQLQSFGIGLLMDRSAWIVSYRAAIVGTVVCKALKLNSNLSLAIQTECRPWNLVI